MSNENWNHKNNDPPGPRLCLPRSALYLYVQYSVSIKFRVHDILLLVTISSFPEKAMMLLRHSDDGVFLQSIE